MANFEKLEPGKNMITHLTSQKPIPQPTPKKTAAQRLQAILSKASEGIDRPIFLAVMGHFTRLDTGQAIHLTDDCHAEIFEGSIEILAQGQGYIRVRPDFNSHYKLYI